MADIVEEMDNISIFRTLKYIEAAVILTNPPEVRDLGQVIAEIGVAVVKPAEFVVFRVSQWAGTGQ